jgi:phenylacetate-coenzyme A ligase PaaK-like adenylate-forming protein
LTDPFSIQNEFDFNKTALELFLFQYECNETYRAYCDLLRVVPSKISNYLHIPFLPVQLFKSHKIYCGKDEPQQVFTSSGTTGQVPSSHFVKQLDIYETSFSKCFQLFYGKPDSYCFLFLLPSYLERSGSSLVYMAEQLISLSQHPSSGFFLHNLKDLKITIENLKKSQQKTILFGVSYALLDLAEENVLLDESFVVMETGGMKGTREEMPKAALHKLLKKKLGVSQIHAEYGMTELLSQAYSYGNGIFSCPPWMKIIIRDPYSPQEQLRDFKTGGVNVIDLANIHSCAFIATQDLGRITGDNQFELMGRFSEAELRGCNLMVN